MAKCIATAVIALVACAVVAGEHADARPLVQVRIDGAIGPASAMLLKDAIDEASDRGARALIVGIDTPGGLSDSMRTMVEDILASEVPVVTWVSPHGARAASAGTFIVYASDVAAMAPATSIGAASPIALGGGGGGGETLEKKAMEDAAAMLRGLAELRERDVDFAERAVREGASMSAAEAHAAGVVDVIAADLDALLAHLDAEGAPIITVDADWRMKLLSIITHPNVAYLLLIIGFYGLLFELSNPGMIFPGVVGAIALLLALFALQLLPVSYAGVGLILLGVALMVGEAFTPSLGALGLGGAAAFVVGSFLLFDAEPPAFRISRALIWSMTIMSAAFLIGLLRLVRRSRGRPVVTGREELIGSTAVASASFDDEGPVRVHGETWRARTESPLRRGDRAEIVDIKGLTLRVRRAGGIS